MLRMMGVLLLAVSAGSSAGHQVKAGSSQHEAQIGDPRETHFADLGAGFTGLINDTDSYVQRENNRAGFVKGVMEEVSFKYKDYNVLVINSSINNENHLEGIKAMTEIPYNGAYYKVWVFEDGKFIIHGDGGYVNWAFAGCYKHVTGKPDVTFRHPVASCEASQDATPAAAPPPAPAQVTPPGEKPRREEDKPTHLGRIQIQ